MINIKFLLFFLGLIAFSLCKKEQFEFTIKFNNNYIARGEFIVKPNTPPSFVESMNGVLGNTQFVKWFKMGIFNSSVSHNIEDDDLFQSGTCIKKGYSYDSYFTLKMQNDKSILWLDADTYTTDGTLVAHQLPKYFVTNAFNPQYEFVDFGNTGFNLFLIDSIDELAVPTYLASATNIVLK